MSDALSLTAATAAARVRAGDLDPAELWDGYRGARRGRRPQRVHLGVGRRRRAVDRDAPLGGVPVAVKDLFCHEGRAEPGGLADPRGLPPAVHRRRPSSG